jgi:hypothetical protein
MTARAQQERVEKRHASVTRVRHLTHPGKALAPRGTGFALRQAQDEIVLRQAKGAKAPFDRLRTFRRDVSIAAASRTVIFRYVYISTVGGRNKGGDRGRRPFENGSCPPPFAPRTAQKGTVPGALQVVFAVNAKKTRMRARAEKSLESATKCGKVDMRRAAPIGNFSGIVQRSVFPLFLRIYCFPVGNAASITPWRSGG